MINIRKLETELWKAADLLRELLQIFNNSAFNEIKDNVVGRIYKYFYQALPDDGVSLLLCPNV